MENEKIIETVTEEKPKEISFFEHESEISRMERTNKRVWILCLIVFFAFVISNLIWLRYEMQFQDVTATITQDLDAGEGGDAVISGDINVNGESKENGNN